MRIVSTPDAPEAIGPYAQAAEAGGMIYCSGQLPINPATGMIEVAGAAEQTMRVLLNLRAVLEAAGSGLDKVVKTTVYLTDLGDFPSMNKVYGEMFANHKPARATVQVARLPKSSKVEIEAIALK
ncbi:MAG: RidA family protein [Kiritimatiellae bacterium]|nr:RidA family protein [Kiritimatiellia bacterium]MDD3543861.1 RidA family protein [Kiritimatiellia bacterium]MDD4025585.1 RidA family protein [Kiritimatiellia bacterium]